MLNSESLATLVRMRRRDVARDVALARYGSRPLAVLGRTLVALGTCAVMVGVALDKESDAAPLTTTA